MGASLVPSYNEPLSEWAPPLSRLTIRWNEWDGDESAPPQSTVMSGTVMSGRLPCVASLVNGDEWVAPLLCCLSCVASLVNGDVLFCFFFLILLYLLHMHSTPQCLLL